MTRLSTRREVLKMGAAGMGFALAGCETPTPDVPFLQEGFESEMSAWETQASIGPEVQIGEFDWRVERSRSEAARGDWSLEVFTEGDHDDGTAWISRKLSPPDDISRLRVTLKAWSQSESFNVLRHLVAYLGPENPTEEGDFPDPGTNSSAVPEASSGGLREPLHLSEGWHEYAFKWEPSSIPEPMYLALGVSVVWEADATHFLDELIVDAA